MKTPGYIVPACNLPEHAAVEAAEAAQQIAEAEHLLHRHHAFAASVAVLQVGIALGAIAALTRMRLAWLASCLLGAIGAALFVWPFGS